MTITVGDWVELGADGIPGFGGLNATMLMEHGWRPGRACQAVDYAGIKDGKRGFVVMLPDGYRLDVYDSDVTEVHYPLK